MKKRTYLTIALIFAALTAISCGPSVLGTCREKAREQQWDADHVDVACYAGIEQKVFLREKEDHAGYVIFYSLLKWTDAVKELQNAIGQLESLRDPKNLEEMQFMQKFGLWTDVMHKEDVLKLRLSMALAANAEDEFKGLTDQISPYEDQEKRGGYDPKKIVLPVGPNAFSFITPEIESAKNAGTLEWMGERFERQNLKYARKKQDPLHPDDKQAFIWKAEDFGLRLVYYRIKTGDEKPDTNVGRYVEGFKTVNGKEESKPALHVFILSSGGVIALMDSKMEGDPGFGLPDAVEQISLYGLDNIREGSSVWAGLFPEKPDEVKDVLKQPKIVVEISPLDGNAHDVWEEKRDGWLLPSNYRIGPKNDNYLVRIDYAKVGGEKPNPNDYATIESVEKVWMTADYTKPSPGDVWEYYRPKPKYASGVKTAILDAEKQIQFDFVDGHQEIVTIVPHANGYIENEPYAIAYSEGKVRYRLEKSPASSVFDRRRIVPMPTNEPTTFGEDANSASEPTPPVN